MIKKQSGQTLFELIMAISVCVVIVTAIVVVTTNSLSNSTFSKNNAGATRFSQEALEWVRSERDKNWTTVYEKSGTVSQYYCLPSLTWPTAGACGANQSIPNTVFLRQISLTRRDLDGNISNGQETVEVFVVVSWNDGSGLHQSTLTTQFTDWKVK